MEFFTTSLLILISLVFSIYLIVELDRRHKIALQHADIRLWASKVKNIIDG